MRDGFVSIATLTPHVRVADVAYNVEQSVKLVRRAAEKGARLCILPELGLTGYTAEDLFWQDALLQGAELGLADLAEQTCDLDVLIACGLPVRVSAKLYNCAAVMCRGRILGLVPKSAIPTYNEFYESRHFCAAPAQTTSVNLAGQTEVPFGTQLLFACHQLPQLVVAFEICEDLWVPRPPSIAHALAGATVVANLSASNDIVGKADYRRDLVRGQSARLQCAYLYTSAGWGESTTDIVFGGHNLICECGQVLAESAPFEGGVAASEIDVARISAERRRMSTFTVETAPEAQGYTIVPFDLTLRPTKLTRAIDPAPFVPANPQTRAQRCEDIFAIQAHGLARRLQHTHSQTAVVGVSGGLDSTLALLVAARALDLLGMSRAQLLAITMPGFGTTNRTHANSEKLAAALGATLREISIGTAVMQHFSDIDHDPATHDVTYENAQARERTQILMDVANQERGLVVGTGDLSELALGWATYNADHMSMYGVNASVPKTLVRHLVHYVATTAQATSAQASADKNLSEVLFDVLDTPVSPELLPAAADGTIAQKTEDLVGPYELHDFFLYHMLRLGEGPSKIYRLAQVAFDGAHGAQAYDSETIYKWLHTFYRRFFQQQFKRSCLPDGPKVGSVAVSPRGDLRMPSDASCALWLSELEDLHA